MTWGEAVLQCVAVCCTFSSLSILILQYVAVCCNVLQYVAVCCSISSLPIPDVAVFGIVMQCVAACVAVCYSVLHL